MYVYTNNVFKSLHEEFEMSMLLLTQVFHWCHFEKHLK